MKIHEKKKTCKECKFLERFDCTHSTITTESGFTETKVKHLETPVYMCLNFRATEHRIDAIAAYFKYIKGIDFKPQYNSIKKNLKTPEFCPYNNAEQVKALDPDDDSWW